MKKINRKCQYFAINANKKYWCFTRNFGLNHSTDHKLVCGLKTQLISKKAVKT